MLEEDKEILLEAFEVVDKNLVEMGKRIKNLEEKITELEKIVKE